MVTQQLLDYVKQQLGMGVGRDAITGVLRAQGWADEDISTAFIQAQGASLSLAPVSSAPATPEIQPQQPAQQPVRSPQAIEQGMAQPVQQPQQPRMPVAQQSVQTPPALQNVAQGVSSSTGDVKDIFPLASIIAGIVGAISFFMPFPKGTPALLTSGIMLLFILTGLVCGILGLKSSRRTLAIIGTILGVLELIVFVSLVLFGVFLGAVMRLNALNQKQGAVVSPTAQASEGALPQNTLASLFYSSKDGSFAITPPQAWTTDDSGKLGTRVIFLSGKTDTEGTASFASNINIVSESAKGLGLDDYVKAQLKLMPTVLQSYTMVHDDALTLNGMPVHLIEATYSHAPVNLHILQLITVKNGKAYTVTATALDSTWYRYQDILNQSLRTFKLN